MDQLVLTVLEVSWRVWKLHSALFKLPNASIFFEEHFIIHYQVISHKNCWLKAGYNLGEYGDGVYVLIGGKLHSTLAAW